MNSDSLKQLLEQVAAGSLEPEQAMQRLKKLPYEDLGFARVDHHRVLRRGFPEVIFGQGKTPEQITAISRALHAQGAAVLVTRVDRAKAETVLSEYPELAYHPDCACLSQLAAEPPRPGKGTVVVIAAGTSDLPVAQEAVLTAELMGSKVETVYDVGVSGLHRLASAAEVLMQASAYVVVAGMEGALPSVVAGLVDKPVVAVPTSVGYGTSFGGLAALLGMLNSCAPGLSVVNIDNGFGGGYLAGLIDHLG
ncbi:nickel pincer cofactor biosynthesis protein LarB [Desulfoferula mesophila]|uniref:1-(5-phosphoribosyl)-5-amino-4-imidazole-carboxylate carboxylase n=1 Tax=Desulfoferula mesophila TaxID=3058419 RepID=A0AAU9F318_9BACT|nr:1-(5-phosphoribosyl)-5-amino-4-imidazole-carboxylate carboxylase [Desulfoferula mesophilus]